MSALKLYLQSKWPGGFASLNRSSDAEEVTCPPCVGRLCLLTQHPCTFNLIHQLWASNTDLLYYWIILFSMKRKWLFLEIFCKDFQFFSLPFPSLFSFLSLFLFLLPPFPPSVTPFLLLPPTHWIFTSEAVQHRQNSTTKQHYQISSLMNNQSMKVNWWKGCFVIDTPHYQTLYIPAL